jgi:hypothetical protein
MGVPADLHFQDSVQSDAEVVTCSSCSTEYEVLSCDGWSAHLSPRVVQNEHRGNMPKGKRRSSANLIVVPIPAAPLTPHDNPDLAKVRKLAETRARIDAQLADAMATAQDHGYSVRYIGQATGLSKSFVHDLIKGRRGVKRPASDIPV